MRLGFDDAVIDERPRHRVFVLVGGRAFGEIGPVVQPVPVAVEIKTYREVAATLNRLVDARGIAFVLRLAPRFGVLKENGGVEVGEFAIELVAPGHLLRSYLFRVNLRKD